MIHEFIIWRRQSSSSPFLFILVIFHGCLLVTHFTFRFITIKNGQRFPKGENLNERTNVTRLVSRSTTTGQFKRRTMSTILVFSLWHFDDFNGHSSVMRCDALRTIQKCTNWWAQEPFDWRSFVCIRCKAIKKQFSIDIQQFVFH